MKVNLDLSEEEYNLVKLAKNTNVNVSQETLAEIGDIFLSNIKL